MALKDFGLVTLEDLCRGEKVKATDEIKNLGLIGDPDTLEKFQKYRAEHAVRIQNNTVLEYALSGDYVDVGRYLSGEPECMVDYNGHDNARFIDITIRTGRVWFTPQRVVFQYYSHVLDLIDKLESEGTRCRIRLGGEYTHTTGNRQIKYSVDFKGYGEPLNLAQLAGLLLNDTFYREVTLAAIGADGFRSNDSRYRQFEPLNQTAESITIPSMYWMLGVEGMKQFQGWTCDWVQKAKRHGAKFFYPVLDRDFVYQEWSLSHLIE